MKRFVLFVLASMLGIGLLSAGLTAHAEDQLPMTEAHVARIRQNCVDAQSNLTQLHASDALMRVSRGRLYETISNKLMAPLNARIAVNRLGGLDLAATTMDYEKQLAQFRANYIRYEESMSATLKLNCVQQPVSFYDSVTRTRQYRQDLRASVDTLGGLVKKYKEQFEAFTSTVARGNGQ